MAKMSKTQRSAILGMFGSITPDADTRGYARLASTRYVLRVNGWTYSGRVTRSGLIAAGVDMDAIHAEALAARPTLIAKEMTDRMSAEGRQVVRDAAHAEAVGDTEWWEARQADEQEIRHMASYGCQIGKAELAATQAASEPTDLIEVQEYLTGELPEDYCPQCEIALVLHPDGLTCDGDRPQVDRRINLH